MAQFAFSLNGMIDGTQKTVLLRYNVDDSVIPAFFEYYMNKFNASLAGMRDPPPLIETETDTYKAWARSVVDGMQAEVRRGAEHKTARQAVAAMPPPTPITEA